MVGVKYLIFRDEAVNLAGKILAGGGFWSIMCDDSVQEPWST